MQDLLQIVQKRKPGGPKDAGEVLEPAHRDCSKRPAEMWLVGGGVFYSLLADMLPVSIDLT